MQSELKSFHKTGIIKTVTDHQQDYDIHVYWLIHAPLSTDLKPPCNKTRQLTRLLHKLCGLDLRQTLQLPDKELLEEKENKETILIHLNWIQPVAFSFEIDFTNFILYDILSTAASVKSAPQPQEAQTERDYSVFTTAQWPGVLLSIVNVWWNTFSGCFNNNNYY